MDKGPLIQLSQKSSSPHFIEFYTQVIGLSPVLFVHVSYQFFVSCPVERTASRARHRKILCIIRCIVFPHRRPFPHYITSLFL